MGFAVFAFPCLCHGAKIDSIVLDGTGVSISYEGDSVSYFIGLVSSNLSKTVEAFAVEMGTSTTQTLHHAEINLDAQVAFYSLQQVPLVTPFDTDLDGIDDVYELNASFLSPLDPVDALLDQDGDFFSNLAEYHWETDPEQETDSPLVNGVSDQDGDGYPDVYETFHSSDPEDWFSVPAPTVILLPGDPVQAALDAAEPYDIIGLTAGAYVGSGSRRLPGPDRPVMLTTVGVAGPAVFDLSGQTNLHGFVFDRGQRPTSVLRGIHVIGASDSYGGAITMRNQSCPTLIDCKIDRSHASNCGGGMYLTDGSSPILIRCDFTNNESGDDGGAFCIREGAHPVFIDCLIATNRAAGDGGGGFVTGPLTETHFANCMFVGNEGSLDGGALAARSGAGVVFRNSFLSDNKTTDDGGALAVRSGASIMVSDSSLSGNTADDNGGTASLLDPGSTLSISQSTVANGISQDDGGMVHAGSQSLIECVDSVFTNNTSRSSGGSLYLTGASTGTFLRCLIQSGSADAFGGGIYAASGAQVDIGDSTIHNNVSTNHGGGLYVTGDTTHASLVRCRLEQNQTGGNGGGMAASLLASIDLQACEILHNSANGSGGGLSWRGQSSGLITQSLVRANMAGGRGGGITVEQAGTDPLLADVEVSANESVQNGGGMSINEGATPMIVDCRIQENTSSQRGGGLSFISGGVADLSGGTVSSNTAALLAGGIYLSGSNVSHRVENCEVVGNQAGDDGGGVACHSHSRPVLARCRILHNMTDGDGGGVACNFSSRSRFENCWINHNQALGRGGGLFAGNQSTSVVVNCTITENTSVDGGGLYHFASSPTTVRNTILWTNQPDTLVANGAANVAFSCLEGALQPGPGNLNQDPGMVIDSFRLTQFSPCIDAGTPSDTPETDIDSEARFDHPTVTNQISFVDIGADEFVDVELDGIADWWEVEHALNPLIDDAADDPDGDGLINLDEYERHEDPQSSTSLIRVSGTVRGSNLGSGPVRVLANLTPEAWVTPHQTTLAEIGDYVIDDLPSAPTNAWLKAFRDSNGNGLLDDCEWRGEFLGNPIVTTQHVSAVDIDLLPGPANQVGFSSVPASVLTNCLVDIGSSVVTATNALGEPVPMTVTDDWSVAGCTSTLIRTWTATTDCGELFTANQTILVVDDEPPVFDSVPPALNLTCGVVPPPPDLSATDTCSGSVPVNLVQGDESADCGLVWSRVWHATDACGNLGMVTQTVFMAAAVSEEVPYLTGFELSEVFQPGPLSKQDEWTASPAVAIQEQTVSAGSQAVMVPAGFERAKKDFLTATNQVATRFDAYLEPGAETPPAPTTLTDPAASVLSYDPQQGLMALDGDGVGGGTWTLIPDTFLPTQWIRVELVTDYENKQWSVSVDSGIPLANLGFKNDSVSGLSAFEVSSGATSVVYLDQVEMQL